VAEKPQLSVGTSLEATKLLRVLKKGSGSKPWSPLLGATLPQSPLSDEDKLRGQRISVDQHPFTVEAGDPVHHSWQPVAASERPDFVRVIRQGA
jgi:hypothetical protein